MDTTSTAYCRTCAASLLKAWKGWPHKDPVPVLPRLDAGSCSISGCAVALDSARINWHNYHRQYNTGLPDFWLLQLDDDSLKRHWGLPYYTEARCPKCRARAIVSEMKFPNGDRELKVNCQRCGVVPLAPKRSPPDREQPWPR